MDYVIKFFACDRIRPTSNIVSSLIIEYFKWDRLVGNTVNQALNDIGQSEISSGLEFPRVGSIQYPSNFVISQDVRALIVDFDGTLVHTYEAHTEPYRQVLSQVIGQEISSENWLSIFHSCSARSDITKSSALIEELQRFVGREVDISAHDLLAQRNSLIKQECESYNIIKNLPLIDIITDFRKYGGKVVLCSANNSDFVNPVLNSLQLDVLFDDLVLADAFSVEEQKPSPVQYQVALERAGTDSEAVLALEDSISGVVAAMEANLSVLVIPPKKLAESFKVAFNSEVAGSDLARRYVGSCSVMTSWTNLSLYKI